MKIISKYKDYYDYIVGIWGEDPLLVLDRRVDHHFKLDHSPYDTKITLHICNYAYDGYVLKDNIYYGDELKHFQTHELGYFDKRNNPTCVIIDNNSLRYKNYFNRQMSSNLYNTKPYISKLNIQEDCPILIQIGNHVNKYPKLSDLQTYKILPPETIWHMLYEWLSQRLTKNEPTVPIGTDSIRIQSHGFDLKTSFRPNIRK